MDKFRAKDLVYFAYNPLEVNHRAAVFMVKNLLKSLGCNEVVVLFKTSKGLDYKLVNFKGNDADAYGHDLHLYDTLTSDRPISVGSFD